MATDLPPSLRPQQNGTNRETYNGVAKMVEKTVPNKEDTKDEGEINEGFDAGSGDAIDAGVKVSTSFPQWLNSR